MAIGTTIDGLNAVTSLTTNDEVPVWDKEASGEPTKKITASNLASSVKSLASLPNTTEMNAAIAQSTALDDRYVTVPYTTTAGGQYNTNLKTIIDNDMPNGKKCVGIVGFTTNNSDVVPVAIRYSDSAYSFQVRNVGTAARNYSATVHYLCVKI